MKQTVLDLNENGHRVGQSHPNARLSNHDVDLIHELHEAGGLSLAAIGEKFGVTRGAVWKIVHGYSRAQTPVTWAVIDPRTGKKRKIGGDDPVRVQQPRTTAMDDLAAAMAGWR